MPDEEMPAQADSENEAVKDEEPQKHVAYKLLSAIGAAAAGEVIYIPEDVGKVLVKAGLAELAGADDMKTNEEPVVDEEPMLVNAIDRMTDKVEKVATDAVNKAMKHPSNHNKLPAEPKRPLYRSNGAYVRDMIRAEIFNDNTARNKARAFEQEVAKGYEDKGFVTKAILGVNETTPASGGFLVNPQFSPDVYAIPHNQLDLAALCEQIDAQSNVYNQRYINESSLANGSIYGGLNLIATAEGATITSSLPVWANLTLTLQKLAVFIYYTTEVLQDASYPVEREVDDYVRKTSLYGINTQIVQGSTLEGLLNAPSLVTVTKSSNDTSFTANPGTSLTYADLALMWASVYPDSQVSERGIWLLHPSLVASLDQMAFKFNGDTAAWGIQYTAEEGLAGQGAMTPYRIFGKKAFAHWACSAPGSAGDILYVDFATCLHYSRPFRVEISRDFQFGTDQVAVRFVNRLDVKTRFRNKVTGPNGAQQFSSVVTRSAAGS